MKFIYDIYKVVKYLKFINKCFFYNLYNILELREDHIIFSNYSLNRIEKINFKELREKQYTNFKNGLILDRDTDKTLTFYFSNSAFFS